MSKIKEALKEGQDIASVIDNFGYKFETEGEDKDINSTQIAAVVAYVLLHPEKGLFNKQQGVKLKTGRSRIFNISKSGSFFVTVEVEGVKLFDSVEVDAAFTHKFAHKVNIGDATMSGFASHLESILNALNLKDGEVKPEAINFADALAIVKEEEAKFEAAKPKDEAKGEKKQPSAAELALKAKIAEKEQEKRRTRGKKEAVPA